MRNAMHRLYGVLPASRSQWGSTSGRQRQCLMTEGERICREQTYAGATRTLTHRAWCPSMQRRPVPLSPASSTRCEFRGSISLQPDRSNRPPFGGEVSSVSGAVRSVL